MYKPESSIALFSLIVMAEEKVQRVIEDDWLYLWETEPRNARD